MNFYLKKQLIIFIFVAQPLYNIWDRVSKRIAPIEQQYYQKDVVSVSFVFVLLKQNIMPTFTLSSWDFLLWLA